MKLKWIAIIFWTPVLLSLFCVWTSKPSKQVRGTKASIAWEIFPTKEFLCYVAFTFINGNRKAVVDVTIIGFWIMKWQRQAWCIWDELKKKYDLGWPCLRKNLLRENQNLQMNRLGSDYSYCKRVFKGFPQDSFKGWAPLVHVSVGVQIINYLTGRPEMQVEGAERKREDVWETEESLTQVSR